MFPVAIATAELQLAFVLMQAEFPNVMVPLPPADPAQTTKSEPDVCSVTPAPMEIVALDFRVSRSVEDELMVFAFTARVEEEPSVSTSIEPAAFNAELIVAASPVDVIRMSPPVEVTVALVFVKAPEPDIVTSPPALTVAPGATVVPPLIVMVPLVAVSAPAPE
jgi:hypothetical protein